MDPTPANLINMFTGYRNMFYEGYGTTPIWSNGVAMQETSDTSLEQYAWMDRLPAMRVWNGPRLVTTPILQNRSVVNIHYEITNSIDRDRVVDDRYGMYSNIIREEARQAAKQPDYGIAALIESNPTCFDGQAFFSTAHPQDTSSQLTTATFNNDLVNLALNPTNFGQVKTQMRNFKGRDNKPFMTYPTHLLVPPNLEEAATVLCESDFFSPATFGGQTQQVGMSKNIYKGQCTFTVIAEFTHPNTWYALYNIGYVKPFLRQIREAINFVFLVNPTDPNVFWQREYAYGGDLREAYDVTLPWTAVRCGAALDGIAAGGH